MLQYSAMSGAVVGIFRLCSLMVCLVLGNAEWALAQQSSWVLQIEVLIEPSPSFQLHSREWGEVFQKLQQRATFRQGRNGEKTLVKNLEVRSRNIVQVVGIMNRDGSISFRDQKFFVTQEERLQAWLENLAQYGATGPPSENATWGLDDAQFKEVLQLLGKPVEGPVDMAGPMPAIDSLRLPAAFRLKFTDAAKERAFSKPLFIGEHQPDLIGLSKGTALAIALTHFGLGFRPLANSSGGYVVEVDAGSESSNLYPVGWKNTAPITSVVPNLAKSVSVDLVDVDLDALIEVIAEKLKLRYFYSAHELKTDGKDVSRLKYTRKPDRLSPNSLMRIIGRTYKIGLSLRTDEAGTIFLWVTTDADYQAFRKRFAHVKPTL